MDAFIGEIRIFTGKYAPRDWAFCNGQLLNIAQYRTLYSVIGTTYGGDGRTTFALPDLREKIPMGAGTGPGLTKRELGLKVGSPTATLDITQLPSHIHRARAQTNAGNSTTPSNNIWAKTTVGRTSKNFFSTLSPTAMSPAIMPTGGSQPHENRQPFLTINYIIALNGDYPVRP